MLQGVSGDGNTDPILACSSLEECELSMQQSALSGGLSWALCSPNQG